jgi:hypothetical protein
VNEDQLVVNWDKYKPVITAKYNVVGCKLLNAVTVRSKYSIASRMKSLFVRSKSIWRFKI